MTHIFTHDFTCLGLDSWCAALSLFQKSSLCFNAPQTVLREAEAAPHRHRVQVWSKREQVSVPNRNETFLWKVLVGPISGFQLYKSLPDSNMIVVKPWQHSHKPWEPCEDGRGHSGVFHRQWRQRGQEVWDLPFSPHLWEQDRHVSQSVKHQTHQIIPNHFVVFSTERCFTVKPAMMTSLTQNGSRSVAARKVSFHPEGFIHAPCWFSDVCS